MQRLLAESEKYKVISEYEMVSLHFKTNNRAPIYIGDFYGDPDSAIISVNEKFVAMAGCGLIVYRLQEPFDEYGGDENTNQYFVFKNSDPDIWWVEGIHQNSADMNQNIFRFTKPEEPNPGLYRFDITTKTPDLIQNSADT